MLLSSHKKWQICFEFFSLSLKYISDALAEENIQRKKNMPYFMSDWDNNMFIIITQNYETNKLNSQSHRSDRKEKEW